MTATDTTPRRIRLSRARSGPLCRGCGVSRSVPSQLGYCSANCRFWAAVDKDGPTIVDHLGPCWMWRRAPLNVKGYGRFDAEGIRWIAHRYAYASTCAPIPNGFDVHHECENTRCVNPSHLLALHPDEHAKLTDQGAYQRRKATCPQGHRYDDVNTRLSATGGRCCRACEGYHGEGTKGERNGSARMTEASVREARQRRTTGERVADLARCYGVSQATMSRVTTGAGWSHVA